MEHENLGESNVGANNQPQEGDDKKQLKPQGSTTLYDELLKGNRSVTTVINEKVERARGYKEGRDGEPLRCFIENTPKEELVLEHVIQYSKQYALLFDEKRHLFMYPKNECDVYKFICTTIRPSKLGYIDLYTYERCANFVSQYITYEELDPPDQFPTVIPSPTNVLAWQKGDAFDIAIVLCSLLVAVGYDAYCVYGIAPREITTKNEALMECPYAKRGEYVPNIRIEETEIIKSTKDEKKVENDLKINKRHEIYSTFDRIHAQQKAKEEEERVRKAKTIDDEEPDYLPEDPYEGRRLHCWVLLKKGARDVEESTFIEPTTGRLYPLKESPYQSIDAVFSHRNFWINMQQDLPVSEVNFDEMNTSVNWEYVMLDTLDFRSKNMDEDGEKEAEEGNANAANKYDAAYDNQIKEAAHMLDMPPPWPPKLYIDRECFLKISPLGENVYFFKKCKVETYADYSQVDGLVCKMTFYDDFKRIIVREVRSFFKHRRDKLQIRRRYPYEFKTIEEYAPSRPNYWKELQEIDSQIRVVKFYPNRNQDGLIMREEHIGSKTIEYYENRDDKVTYRSVRFVAQKEVNEREAHKFKDNHVGDTVITKMTQKFSKHIFAPPREQIAKMVIDFVKHEIVLYYHMDEGDIAPVVKVEQRKNLLGLAKINENEKKYDDEEQQKQHKLFNMEKECLLHITTQEDGSRAEVEQKNKFEETINNCRSTNSTETVFKDILDKTLFDKAREKFKDMSKKKADDMNKDAKEQDILAPFLEAAGLPLDQQLNYQQALEIKNKVMDNLKSRILARAQIIQTRLEEEDRKLKKAQTNFQKRQESGLKDDTGENLEEQINQLQFKLEILDERAARFEDMAMRKYQQMDEKLSKDGRLKILQDRK